MSATGVSESEARALVAGLAPSEPAAGQSPLERYARASWSCLVEPGDGVAGIVVSMLGARRALDLLAEGASAQRIAAEVAETGPADSDLRRNLTVRIADGLKRWTPRLDRAAVDRSISLARRTGTRLVLPSDAEWPQGLSDLGPHAPLALWMRGRTESLASLSRSIALVGARAASAYGEDQTAEAANGLVGRGFSIVSGAAYGIDGVAHRTAIASGGVTIAFLAGGVDRPYPAGHHELLDRMRERGAVLAEVPSGAAPTRWRFLQRNRLIAAASRATVVMEAGWRSGSLNTAGHAAELGRPLGALPGRVDSPSSAGCHRLIRDYAAVCVTSADEMAELVDAAPSLTSGRTAAEQASADETRVIDALSVRSARAPGDLARRAGLPVEAVEGVLGVLELEGRAIARADGWVYRPR